MRFRISSCWSCIDPSLLAARPFRRSTKNTHAGTDTPFLHENDQRRVRSIWTRHIFLPPTIVLTIHHTDLGSSHHQRTPGTTLLQFEYSYHPPSTVDDHFLRSLNVFFVILPTVRPTPQYHRYSLSLLKLTQRLLTWSMTAFYDIDINIDEWC